jgi:hypothetical protein
MLLAILVQSLSARGPGIRSCIADLTPAGLVRSQELGSVPLLVEQLMGCVIEAIPCPPYDMQ